MIVAPTNTKVQRSFVLKRVASIHTSASASGALQALIPIEESLEIARKNGDASYVPSKHVEVLIAMIAEFRTFRQNLA